MKKRYIVGNFFKQVLMANIEGVKIVGFEEIIERDRELITFEFDDSNAEVNELLNNYRAGAYTDMEIPNFAEMKKKRKELIREYLDSCYNK